MDGLEEVKRGCGRIARRDTEPRVERGWVARNLADTKNFLWGKRMAD
jgi:hypothetical protein